MNEPVPAEVVNTVADLNVRIAKLQDALMRIRDCPCESPYFLRDIARHVLRECEIKEP